jgi:hypothetical protein
MLLHAYGRALELHSAHAYGRALEHWSTGALEHWLHAYGRALEHWSFIQRSLRFETHACHLKGSHCDDEGQHHHHMSFCFCSV